jgi:Mrp family chromosome partitioning ATPase
VSDDEEDKPRIGGPLDEDEAPAGPPGSPAAPAGSGGPGGGEAGDPDSVVPATEAQKEQAKRQFELKMRVRETLDDIDQTICVMSGKGGVGKSTVAVNLAVAFARTGLETGLGDFDFTNPNDPTMLGLEDEHMEAYDEDYVKPKQARDNLGMVSTGFLVEGEAPIAWRGPIKMGVMRQFLADLKWDHLDVFVVDLPPGTSDEALSVAQTFPTGTPCLIVTTPQETSMENVQQNVEFCEKNGLDVVGVVENFAGMTCPSCGDEVEAFPGDGGDRLAQEADTEVLARLPLDPNISRAQDEGTPAVEGEPNEVGRRLSRLAEDLRSRVLDE